MKVEVELDGYKVKYNYDDKTKEKLFNYLFNKFIKLECFSGEDIYQCDHISEASYEILSTICKIFDFEIEYNDE